MKKHIEKRENQFFTFKNRLFSRVLWKTVETPFFRLPFWHYYESRRSAQVGLVHLSCTLTLSRPGQLSNALLRHLLRHQLVDDALREAEERIVLSLSTVVPVVVHDDVPSGARGPPPRVDRPAKHILPGVRLARC